MVKGGYKIINLKDTVINADGGTTIAGIYEEIEHNYRKPLLLSGIIIENVEKPDVFISVTNTDGSFNFDAYGKKYTITNADLVTIA